MANSTRMGRINDDIQLALSSLLRSVKDPRVQQGLISVTRVETTGDLRYAKVWLSVLGELNEKEFNAVMAGETLPQREDPDAKPAEDQPAVQPVEQAETAEAAEPAEPAEAVDAAPQEAPAPEMPDEGEANQ